MPKLHRSLEVFLRQPVPVTATREEAEQALTRIGYSLSHHKGSHYTWRHPDGSRIVYALIGGRMIGKAAVKDIAEAIRRLDSGE